MHTLKIENLTASVENKTILKDLNIEIMNDIIEINNGK